MPSVNICSWNANGLRPKFAELKQFITRFNIDIMLVNETKLTEKILLKMKNFHIIRKERTANGGGGVALIVSEKIAFKICNIPNNISFECICIQLMGNTFIVAAYNEPRNRFNHQELSSLTDLGNRVLNGR